MRFPPPAGDVHRVPTWRLFISIEVASMVAVWAYLLVGPGLEQVLLLRQVDPGISLWLALARAFGFLVAVVAAIFGPVIVPVVVLRVLARALRAIDRVWPGRALGVFGLAIALLGFLLSAYQMLMS